MNRIRFARPLVSSLAVAALLSACSAAQQSPAPVVNGSSNGGAPVYSGSAPVYSGNSGSVSSDGGNPYGINTNGGVPAVPGASADLGSVPVTTAPPYTAPSAPVVSAPAAGTGGTYVPNYAPVDRNAVQHRVVQGDTVYNISKRYGITEDQLRQWNNLSDNNIVKGQTLRVKPFSHSGSGSAPVINGTNTHRVVAGDTVYNISKRYGMSENQLRQLNNLSGNNIHLGQVLNVRGGTQSTPVAAPPVAVSQPAPVITVTQPVETPAITATPAPVSSARANTRDGIAWQTPMLNARITEPYQEGKTRGIKIGNGAGQNVLAAATGQVIHIGPLRNHGTVVIVQHSPKYLTAYGQVQNVLVGKGQNVQRGQPLAVTGSQPLYFEIRSSGTPQNPAQYISF
ncbi:LysM peptidoglycan-binding domain-containing protein [Kingella denitrificans]